jgi:hypothetical protein
MTTTASDAGFGGEELKAEARLVREDGVVHGPVSRGVSGGGELSGFGGGLGHGVDFHKGEVAVHESRRGPKWVVSRLTILWERRAVGHGKGEEMPMPASMDFEHTATRTEQALDHYEDGGVLPLMPSAMIMTTAHSTSRSLKRVLPRWLGDRFRVVDATADLEEA